MRRALVLAAALALALVGPAAVSPAAAKKPKQFERLAPDPPLRGFDTASPTLGFHIPGGPGTDLKRAKELGANTVRVVMSWRWLEPDHSQLHPGRAARMDKFFKKVKRLKLGVIATPLFTPCWVSSAPREAGGSCSGSRAIYPPKDYGAFREYVKRIVNRWGETFAGLEIWNEPNLPIFWLGSLGEYVQLVNAAAKGVEASHYRDTPVVGGALSGADTDYLRRLLNAGMANATDAISIHPYDLGLLGFGNPAVLRNGDRSSFRFGVPQFQKALADRGVKDPIWITEFGYPDCPGVPYCVSPADQAKWLASAAQTAAGWPYVDAFLIYRLRDWAPQTGLMEARFGLLNLNGTPKPAAGAVAAIFKAARR